MGARTEKEPPDGGSVYREASKGWDEDPSGQFGLPNCHEDTMAAIVNERLTQIKMATLHLTYHNKGATVPGAASEFLEGWFAAFYRFDGLILVLQAFFDETLGGKGNFTAVAGFVYDKAGLTEFTNAWALQVHGLSKSYRSSPCNAAKEPFDSRTDWPNERRQKLMNELATLSADHALAGFVVATGEDDYEDAMDNGPGIGTLIPCLSGYHPHPLYVVCLLGLQARAGAGALRRRSG